MVRKYFYFSRQNLFVRYDALQTLYNLKARKVAVMGLLPLGCLPQTLSLFPANATTGCVEGINDAVKLFNTKLISLVQRLNANLQGAEFTYLNLYKYYSEDFETVLGKNIEINFE